MPLAEEYSRQFQWREWNQVFDRCPILPDDTVLDLGCGSGEIAHALAEQGAKVTAIDGDADLIAGAKARFGGQVNFLQSSLTALPPGLGTFDGIWCSFTAAYFPDFFPVLSGWLKHLKPGGWLCLVEIDDLLHHRPLAPEWIAGIQEFYARMREEKKYDFLMGRKLDGIVAAAGRAPESFLIDDKELTSSRLSPEILQAWQERLERMPALRKHFGNDFPEFQRDFLSQLASPEHQSGARVFCCIS